MLRTSIYEWMYDYVSAIAEYNNIEKEYGAFANIYYYKSICYNEIGHYDHAIAEITKYIEMGNAKDYYGLAQRADYYREAGRYDEAIADFSKMIEIEPMEAYPYYKRGWCYELKGDDKSAMENYNAGIDVDKTYPYIYLMRGELYEKQGLKELANADFEEILKKDTVAEAGSCRQYALHFLDRNDEAIEWMNKMIENGYGLNPSENDPIIERTTGVVIRDIIEDTLPFSYGIRCREFVGSNNFVVHNILKKGDTLPATGSYDNFRLVGSGTSVKIEVYESECSELNYPLNGSVNSEEVGHILLEIPNGIMEGVQVECALMMNSLDNIQLEAHDENGNHIKAEFKIAK
jgi:tetratricopeptide (TPR) repeat protein